MSVVYPTAIIEGLYIARDPGDFYTEPVNTMEFVVDPNGIADNTHYIGNTIQADGYAPVYSRGKDVVLNRQAVSVVGGEDLDLIADELELVSDVLVGRYGFTGNEDPRHITRSFLAQCLGANVLVKNFRGAEIAPSFCELLPATDFGPYDQESHKFTDATVMITRSSAPSVLPGIVIQNQYPIYDPDISERFANAVQGRRGFVGMVAKAGKMSVGQQIGFVPFGM